MRPRPQWHHAAAVAAFTLLAIAQTWPLAAHLSTHLPGTHVGDNASFAWNVWWMREAIGRADASFFYTDALFAPLGASLVLHTHTAPGAALAALLPADVITATNLLVIACVALNGLAAYAVALHVSGSRRAAALAGVLFLGAPPLSTRLMGHFNLLYAWTLVLALGASLRAVETRSVPWSLAAGAAAGLVAWADYYLFVYTVAAVAVVAVGHWGLFRIERRRREPTRIRQVAGTLFLVTALLGIGALLTGRTSANVFTIAWALAIAWVFLTWRIRLRVERRISRVEVRTVGIAALALAAALAPLAWRATRLWLDGDYVSPPRLWRSAPPGFDLATLVMGPPWHALTGAATRAWYDALGIDAMEMSGWLGVVAPVLAILALRERAREPARRTWMALALIFLVWAAGAFLHAGGVNTGVLLPQQALRYVPVMANARMPARALIVVSLAAALLAALWVRGRRPALAWLLCAAAVAEQIVAPLPLARVPRRGVDLTLAASGPGAVLEVPFGYRDGFGMRGRFDETALLGQIVHRHPIAGGFISRVPRKVDAWYADNPTLRALLDVSSGSAPRSCEAARADLAAAGVRYVIVTGKPIEELQLPLRRLEGDGVRTLYVMEDRCAGS